MPSKDVIIVCEFGAGQSDSGNGRLIVYGKQLADRWGGQLICLVVCERAEDHARVIGNHADEVYFVEFAKDKYDSVQHKAALNLLVDTIDPRAILCAHTFVGIDLVGALAARLCRPAILNCLWLEAREESLVLERPIHRGKLVARIEVDTFPLFATLQPGGEPPGAPAGPGTLKPLTVDAATTSGVEHIALHEPNRSGVDITKFEVLVSGGRGVGERENFVLVENLAKALGGVAACSRPLVDMGWFDATRQVGLSGNSVKPQLYVACGISGAAEHLHGMKDASTIVAINSDPDAPIFNVAHFGIIGDLKQILPALTKQINE